MNVSLPKLSAMLALLLLPLWHWAQSVSLDTYQNTAVSYDFVSSPNSPGITISPSFGELELIETSNFNYSVQYTPDTDYIGSDHFRILRWATSPAPHLELLDVTVTVEPALIQANHDYSTTTAGQAVTIDVLENDLSSNGIKLLRAIPAVNHGTAAYNEGESVVTFQPAAGFSGLAHFNYVICNGLGDCDEGTVSISVMPAETPTEDEIIRVFTEKNQSQFILVPPEYQWVSGPENGIYDAGADVPEYHPQLDYTGMDEIVFTYQGHQLVFDIEVLNLEENTFAFDDRFFTTTNSGISLDVLENDLSVSGSCLSYTQAENGTIVHPNGSPAGYFEYTPDPGFVGVDQFTYTTFLTSCAGDPETATVNIFVSNFEPDRSTFHMATPKETPIIIGYNVPVATFRFEVSAQGELGSAFFLSGEVDTVINGVAITGHNLLIYTPDEGVTTGIDEFEITYCLEDPSSNTCAVSKTVKVFMEILDVGSGEGPVCVGDCVWPGDTNFDGLVSMADLLPIGLSMGEVGSSRPDVTFDYWYGQYADDWGSLFGGAESNVDLKHIDADGNSIVTATDTTAIQLFYGRTHSMVPEVLPYVPYDFILEGPLFVQPGDLVNIKIKIGTADQPADDVYGFVFPYLYNPDFVEAESVRVSWNSSSWLTYSSPVLHMQHNDFGGFLEAGYTRTSGISASGHGEIGQLQAIITDDLIGIRPDSDEIAIEIGGIDGSVMNSAGQMSAAYIQPYTLRVRLKNDEPEQLNEDQLLTYPNPTKDYLSVHLNGGRNFQHVAVYSLTGQLVQSVRGVETNHAEINLNNLPNGIYILEVATQDGLINKKVQVLH